MKVDGQIGEATLAAIEAYPDNDRLIALIIDWQLGLLQVLKLECAP